MDKRTSLGRRQFLAAGAMLTTCALSTSSTGFLRPPAKSVKAPPPLAPRAVARPGVSLGSLDPQLFKRALAALDTHSGRIKLRDRIGIIDFSASSSEPRFHFVDITGGKVTPQLVAHGSGSDPGHTGFLQRFSNAVGSNASSEGAFATGQYYVGQHGRSQRLTGLDPTNNNAFERAIVVHGAWYANADMIQSHGKLGRSQGCFAVGEQELGAVFDHLGEGRLIFAARA